MSAKRADPFPKDRFTALLGRLPRYARLAWRLGRSDRLPRSRRAALLAGAAYLASPIDVVPGVIPVAGQLDDAAAVLLALRYALNGLPDAERRASLEAVGLDERAIGEDLRTIGAVYAWLARQGARLAWRGTRSVARLTGRVAAGAVRAGRARVSRGDAKG